MLNIGGYEFPNFDAAKASLLQATEQNGGDAPALQMLGEVYAIKGQAGQAIDAYERAAAAQDTPQARLRLGELYLRSGRTEDAERCLDAVLSASVHDPEIAERLASAYVELADAHFAELSLEKALLCHGKSEMALPGQVDRHVDALLKEHIHKTLPNVASPIEAAAEGGATCHGAVVVWGQEDVAFFLSACLPSLLAPGNLPYLAEQERVLFVVYADAQSIRVIDEAEPFRELKKHAEILFVEIPQSVIEVTRHESFDPELRQRNAQRLTAAHHQIALRVAKEKGAGLFNIMANWVLSDGALKAMYLPAKGDKDYCVAPVLIADRDAMMPEVDGARSGAPTISLSASALTRLSVDHLHSSLAQFFPQGTHFLAKQFPSRMLWRFGDKGLILHSFHWSTVFMTADGVARYGGARFWSLHHRLLDALLRSDEDWERVGACGDTGSALIVAMQGPDSTLSQNGHDAFEWDLNQLVAHAQPDADDLSMTKANLLLLKERVVFDPLRERAAAQPAAAAADHLVDAITAVFSEVSLGQI